MVPNTTLILKEPLVLMGSALNTFVLLSPSKGENLEEEPAGCLTDTLGQAAADGSDMSADS